MKAQPGYEFIFRNTEYSNGKLWRQTYDTIIVQNEIIDIKLFKQHFSIPISFPNAFIDIKKKGETISKWGSEIAKKDYEHNWTDSYSYDSLGRFIKYNYSSCVPCSQMAWAYTVKYDSMNRIERIEATTDRLFKFYYDERDRIVRYELYNQGQLETEIILINN
jgi:hypothetical protein